MNVYKIDIVYMACDLYQHGISAFNLSMAMTNAAAAADAAATAAVNCPGRALRLTD